MGLRIALLAAVFVGLLGQPSLADVRTDAIRLLAHRVRQSGVDPKNIAVSDVVVRANQALLSWNSGKARGVMVLLVSSDRWWDALDMTTSLRPNDCWNTVTAYPLVANVPYPSPYQPPSAQSDLSAFKDDARLRPAALCDDPPLQKTPDLRVHPAGAAIHPPGRQFTGGYDITIAYAANDAEPDAKLEQLFARAPSAAEFAPNHPPAPGWGGPDAVAFFDLAINAAKRVTFERGTTVDVWFPFVLDDQLRYNLSFVSAGKPSGMIFGTVFDNTLHFVLPQFSIDPGEPLMAEIDGDVKGPS